MLTRKELEYQTLSFLNIIKEDEKISLSAEIQPALSLSKEDNNDGTMLFESGFLSQGWRKGINNSQPIWIPEDEIKKSVDNPINKDFPVKFNHNYDTPNVGVILRLYFDETKKMLMAEGRINDKITANFIKKQKIKRVSITVFGKVVYINERPTLTNLRYNELSLVKSGENPGNFIKEKN